jgi:hypothetical protein
MATTPADPKFALSLAGIGVSQKLGNIDDNERDVVLLV